MSECLLLNVLVPVFVFKQFYEIKKKHNVLVDSDPYFQDLLTNLDIFFKHEKKKKPRFGIRRSPLSKYPPLTNLSE